MRVLLNEKLESSLVDRRQSAGAFRQSVRCAPTVIDQRHFAKNGTHACALENKITQTDFHFPFQKHIHFVAEVALPEKEVAGRQLDRVSFVTKEFCRIHKFGAYRGKMASSKLQSCNSYYAS
jgi:hypothetical protein